MKYIIIIYFILYNSHFFIVHFFLFYTIILEHTKNFKIVLIIINIYFFALNMKIQTFVNQVPSWLVSLK